MLDADFTLGELFDMAIAVAEAQPEFLSETDLRQLRELLSRSVDVCEIDSELAPWYAQRIDALES